MASARRTLTNEQIDTGGNNTRTYDFGAGGLASWETASERDHPSASESDVLECYDDAASFDDTATISGATNNATHSRMVRAAAGEGHDGTSNNGITFSNTGTGNTFRFQENDVQIQDLILSPNINTADLRRGISTSSAATDLIVVGCIVFDALNSGSGVVRSIQLVAADIVAALCLVENGESTHFEVGVAAQTVSLYNSVSIDSGGAAHGVEAIAGTVVCKNVLSTGSGGSDFTGAGSFTGSDFNAAGDATDPGSGANNRVSQTFSFVNAGGNDYHITYSDLGAHDFGQDLSADGVFAFDDDIDGTLWDAWDIGFNEPGGPFVRSRALSTEDATNVTSHTVQLPTPIEAGDIIVVNFAVDGAETVTWPNEGTEWMELFTTPNGTAVTGSVAWKEADGTEDGTTIEVVTGSAERSSHSSVVVGKAEDPDVTPPESQQATGGGNAPNPPNQPADSLAQYLFIVGCAVDRDRTVVSVSANYDHENTQVGGGANSVTASTAERQLETAAAENPGTYTMSAADEWVAWTLKIHPPAGVVIPAWLPRRTSFGQEMRLRR